MTRPTLFLVFAAVFAVGAVWWTQGDSEAAKKRKPEPAASSSCDAELAKVKQELAAAREDARKAREEAKVARAEADTLRKTEAERVKRLESQLGTAPVDTLK